MDVDEYRDYKLGLIFYKYLSGRLNLYVDEAFKHDGRSNIHVNVLCRVNERGSGVELSGHDARCEQGRVSYIIARQYSFTPSEAEYDRRLFWQEAA